MSAQRPANSKHVDALRWGLRVGLLGLLMTGCQTASLRSVADRPATVPSVAESTVIVPQSSRHIPCAVRNCQADGTWNVPTTFDGECYWNFTSGFASKGHSLSPVASAIPLKNRASFTLVNWQNEEPPPLVGSESDQNSIAPLSDSPPEYVFDDGEISFRSDLCNALPTLWCDTKSIANWNNALILTAAGGLAIGFHQSDIDQQVRDEVAEHPERWGRGSQVLGYFGEVKYQAPVMLGVYGYSVWRQNEELHDVMGSMLSATVITGVSTSALKLIANTDRPSDKFSNGHYGFPSYHTSSTFAIAAVLDEYYGSHVGLPAYALATAVGFSRIDQQAHDLSDVVFGAALGYVIGKTVATRHLCDESNLELSPYIHPTDGTPGIAIEARF